jgi:hypothetical protein
MSNKVSYDTIQSQINNLQQQINDIETGSIQIDFLTPYHVLQGSTTLDPKTGLYNGTQAFVTNNNVDTNANINGSKLADNSITNSKLTTVDGSRIVDGTITSSKISNGTIVDIDIAGNAAIAVSKLSNGTNGDILQINNGVPTWTAPSSNLPPSTQQNQILSSDSNLDPIWVNSISQNQVTNLSTDLSSIVTNVSTLQSYFNASRLKLANLTKSSNNYQVLSQDSSANDPAYRQLDSNYISSLDQSKINQNNNNQYIKYCDSLNFNNITTFVN